MARGRKRLRPLTELERRFYEMAGVPRQAIKDSVTTKKRRRGRR